MRKRSLNKIAAMLEKQNHEVRVRANIIETVLSTMKDQNHKPKNRTAISKILAQKISEIEGKSCSYTTILRNDTYKSLIDEFMQSCGYDEAREKKDIQSDLLSARLEIRELRKENSQLNRMLSKSQEEIAALEHLTSDRAPRISKTKTNDSEHRAFIVIRTLLGKLELEPDRSFGHVIDDMDGTLIFDSDMLPEYFKWLKENDL